MILLARHLRRLLTESLLLHLLMLFILYDATLGPGHNVPTQKIFQVLYIPLARAKRFPGANQNPVLVLMLS